MLSLRFSPTSPYVRKVRAAAIEVGLHDRLNLVSTDPWSADTDLPTDNPLGKVPALTTEDGTVLYDSPVICEYLDSLHDGPKLFPASGSARWQVLQTLALGDGMTDAAVARRLEDMRPAERQHAPWRDRQRTVISRAVDALEQTVAALSAPTGPVTIADLSVACALGYLDFRFADDAWRNGRPKLAAWFDAMANRPSIRDTGPPAP